MCALEMVHLEPGQGSRTETEPLASRSFLVEGRFVQRSGWDFREHVQAIDCGGDSELVAVLHPNDPGLAACPLLFPQSEFRRQYQDDFQLAAFRDSPIRVEEDAAHAEVPRDRRDLGVRILTSYGRGKVDRDAGACALVGLGIEHGSESLS